MLSHRRRFVFIIEMDLFSALASHDCRSSTFGCMSDVGFGVVVVLGLTTLFLRSGLGLALQSHFELVRLLVGLLGCSRIGQPSVYRSRDVVCSLDDAPDEVHGMAGGGPELHLFFEPLDPDVVLGEGRDRRFGFDDGSPTREGDAVVVAPVARDVGSVESLPLLQRRARAVLRDGVREGRVVVVCLPLQEMVCNVKRTRVDSSVFKVSVGAEWSGVEQGERPP